MVTWQLVAEQAHQKHESVRVTTTWKWSYVADKPQRGSGATMRESPENGSGARLRTTAVTEPEHARAFITEDWWFGSTDMHEEKNIDTSKIERNGAS